MERIIKKAVDMEHYLTDACIVWCFDDRFSSLLTKIIKERKMKHIDLVKIAGGAKPLAGKGGAERDFLISQIAASVKLHHPPILILMTHSDCGAYNLKFRNSSEEIEFYTSELSRARETAVKSFPNLKVETLFADANGVVEV